MDGLWEGVGLKFVIAGGSQVRLAVDVILISMVEAAMVRSSFVCATFIAASWALMIIMVGDTIAIGLGLTSGSGRRLCPRSSLLDSGFPPPFW